MAFVIVASQRGEPIRATRLQGASAAVLATRLTDEGCTDVAIMDAEGDRPTLARFQRKHLSGRSERWRGL